MVAGSCASAKGLGSTSGRASQDELCSWYSECEDEPLAPWADAWEDSSETASTVASTVEVTKVERKGGKAAAWNLAVQQAAMNAKQ